jgi:phosphoserine aminotransferase
MSDSTPVQRALNFNAGPAGLPLEVMQQAHQELLSYNSTGMSVMEMSHRSPEFEAIIAQAESNLRSLLNIPNNYHVLFMQGGATTVFSAIPLNFLRSHTSAAYLVTGSWSHAAAEEAKRYCQSVHIVHSTAPAFDHFPATTSYSVPSDAAYLHYCHNETVHGVEANHTPNTHLPLIADFSSSFCSQPIDIAAHAVVYAGAQKNVGPAGVTIVIARDNVLGSPLPITPLMLNYTAMAKGKSMYNTPPTYAIYMTGLVLQWVVRQGGVEAMRQRSVAKSERLYAAIDASGGYYRALVRSDSRSRMNVVFAVGGGKADVDAFVAAASERGMVGLAGHRSVGGCRASLYNAVTVEQVDALIAFMKEFASTRQTVK